MKSIVLTVFSFGAGQDSSYMLHKICTDKAFREKHIQGRLLVVGSDTGDEHTHTYQSIEKMKALCIANGIEFHWITSDMGYHSNTWQSLTYQYKRNSSIGSAAFRQTCTDNLKVKVVDRFVELWIGREYGYSFKNKKNYLKFHEDHGGIRLILGFAKAEESRIANGNKFDAAWKKKAVERYYPLIVDGIDRQACIDYNEANMNWKIFPSNCMRCFYQSDQEILWLYRFEKERFLEWVKLEAAKLDKYADAEKNFAVYGKITLLEKLDKAMKLYGHWTDAELMEYKYSHGHCIKSKY